MRTDYGDNNNQYDMAKRFRIWFEAGFIICTLSLLYSLLVWAFLLSRKQCFAKIAHLSVIVTTIFSTVWVCVGAAWRFGRQGRVCSGQYVDSDAEGIPYQWHSGRFMEYYVIGMLVLYAIMIYCAFVVCCGMATGRISRSNGNTEI